MAGKMIASPDNGSALGHVAMFWRSRERGKVQCLLCPFNCSLGEGKTGICRGKQNVGGELLAVNYALTTSLNLDPIEKKPLYHFYPGTSILSVGPNGCNLRCDFCQNYAVSQDAAPTRYLSPDEAVSLAKSHGSIGIAYTYSEPLIWYEYVLDTSRKMRDAGLKNVLVTNGLINQEPLMELIPWIDAMNIDLKSMDPRFYKKILRGMLAPVLETIKTAAGSVHLEITCLVIPGLNDSVNMFERLRDFIADIDPLIPLHLSAYHPDYKQTAPPTPLATLVEAVGITSEKLKHVYLGNARTNIGADTVCPECGKTLIARTGYIIGKVKIVDGLCAFCGAVTGIVN